MEGHGRSRKVKEGHGWSFPITRLTFQVRKVIGGGRVCVCVCVACRILAPVPVSFLWTWDLGLGIWDMEFGLDNKREHYNCNLQHISIHIINYIMDIFYTYVVDVMLKIKMETII